MSLEVCRVHGASLCWTGTDKDGAYVAFEEVAGHVLCYARLVLLEHGNISRAHFRGDFEGDVDELSQAAVVSRRVWVVPQRFDPLLRCPSLCLGRGRERC